MKQNDTISNKLLASFFNQTARNATRFNRKRKIMPMSFAKVLLLMLLTSANHLTAQVASYSFASTNETYTPLANPTVLIASGWDDAVISTPIPFAYKFAGLNFNQVNVSTNGFVTFGATSPHILNFTPISSTEPYLGVISAFGRDIRGNASSITTGTEGTFPNRVFVIQWNNAARYNGGSDNLLFPGDVLNFQIRLHESSNIAQIRYGTCNVTSTANDVSGIQVGLRSSPVGADFNNRAGGFETPWTALTAGTTRAATVNFKATVTPTTGLTFTYIPPCIFTNLPHFESFDSVGSSASCWSKSVSGTNNWFPTAANDGVPSPHSGAAFAGKLKSSATNDISLYISTPYNLIAFPTDETQLRVWIYRNATVGLTTDRTTFYANTAPNLTGATLLLDIPLPASAAPAVATSGWYEYTAQVPLSFNTGGNFYIIASGTTSTPSASRSVGFDDYAFEFTPPVLTGFSPATACSADVPSTVVTLTGSRFTDVTDVKLNGVSKPFTVVNDTTITVALTAGTTSGTFSVYNSVTSVTSTTSFTVNPPPTVASITGGSPICLSSPTLLLSDATPSGVWASSNNAVATVDGGMVTAQSAGTVTISYTVTNLGCATTVTTEISIYNPVEITTQPMPQAVVTGNNGTFSIAATGAGLSYQWYESVNSGAGVALSNNAVFSGVTTNTLTISAAQESPNQRAYYCVVTGTAPCNPQASNTATLFVGNVAVTSQPVAVYLCDSGTALYAVAASGVVVGYQWYETNASGTTPIANGGDYSGANTATLTINNSSNARNGFTYYATVTGPANAVNSAVASLNFTTGITVNTNPSNRMVCYSGGSTTFSVAASGAVSGYQWEYSTDNATWASVANDTPIGATYTNATTATLGVTTLATTPAAGNYYYRARITANSPCPVVLSESAQLQINKPIITTQPVNSVVYAGNSTTFSASTDAIGTVTYQWQRATTLNGTYVNVSNGTPVYVNYAGANTATLTVTTLVYAPTSTTDFYRLVVSSNGCIVNSDGAQLTINNYCAIPPPSTSDSYFNAFTTTGGLSNINNTNSGFAPNGYGDYLALSASQYLRQPISFSTTLVGGPAGVAIWVDWNHNRIFEASERVANTTVKVNAFSGTFTVPESATVGNTRMRILVDYDSTNPTNPCPATGGRREVEDYTFTVVTPPACASTPTAATITTPITTFCLSGTATLTASNYNTIDNGLVYQWYNSAGPIPDATGATYTTPVLTANETYYFRVTCLNSGLFSNSNSIAIVINNPTVTVTNPASRCGAFGFILSATASAGATFDWYTEAVGGLYLYSGSFYPTGVLLETKTYYIEPRIGGAVTNLGPISPSIGTYGNTTANSYEIFDAAAAVTLTSVDVFPRTAGTVIVELRNAAGTVLQTSPTYTVAAAQASTTLTSVGTPVSIPINFSIVPGTGYRLSLKSTSTATLVRNTAGASATYGPSNGITITGNSNGIVGYYNNFYNWRLTSGCRSSRVPVTATIIPTPYVSLSANYLNICPGTSSPVVTITSPISDYESYTWTPSEGVSGTSATGYTFNPSVSTFYQLTANAASGCQQFANIYININSLPSPVVTPAAATTCANGSPVALSANASPLDVVLGTGTALNSPTGYPSPLSNYFGGSKHQMLIKASELTALGFVAGDKITALTLNVSAVGATFSGSLNEFKIDVIYTARNDLASIFDGNVIHLTVRPASTLVVPTTNLPADLTIPFTNHFSWNGQNNIIIQMSYSNANTGTATDFVLSTNSNPGFVATSFYRANNATPAAIRAAATPTGSSASRPNMRLTKLPAIAYTWAPLTGLYTDAAGISPYTGGSAATVYARPTATQTYTVSATNTTIFPSCYFSGTTTITVDPVSVAGTASGTTTICSGSSTTVSLSGNVGTIQWQQSANGTSGWTDISGATATSLPTGSLTATTYYRAVVTNGVCSSATSDTVIVSMNPNANITYYQDADGDGFGNPAVTQISCTGVPSGYVSNSLDCNDNEIRYLDADNDGFGSSSMTMVACGGSLFSTDCDDANPAISPGAVDSCADGIDNDCNGVIDNVGLAGGCIPILATLQSTQCGATISSLSVTINATYVVGAQGYRFKITNLVTNAVVIVDRPVNSFALSSLPGINLGTPYQVEVALKLNNIWQPFYGTPCLLSTPSPVTTIGAQCGTTLTSMGQFVYATYVSSVTAYRFRITNLSTNAVQEYDALAGQNRFTFNQLSAAIRAFGTTYAVEVALRNTDGTYLPYGDSCTISTPDFPSSEIVLSQCDALATSTTQSIAAVVVPGATEYRFQLTNAALSYNFSVDRPLNTFSLGMFPGLQPNTAYTVRVAVKIGGVWGPFNGKACSITTPDTGVATRVLPGSFAVTAYPNPFEANFALDVKTKSSALIHLRVYNMLGKLVAENLVDASQIQDYRFGDGYPSGVYTVIVSQDSDSALLRVVRR